MEKERERRWGGGGGVRFIFLSSISLEIGRCQFSLERESAEENTQKNSSRCFLPVLMVSVHALVPLFGAWCLALGMTVNEGGSKETGRDKEIK